MVHLTVSDRQNGVNPPKTAKLFKIHTQDAYVLSEISKTVFEIFLAQYQGSYRVDSFNGVRPPKRREPAENGKIVLNTHTGRLRFV